MVNENLARMPQDWHLTYGEGKQIIALDSEVLYDGKPTIRLDPHVDGEDVNIYRECDGTWLSVKAGDHIIAKAKILVQQDYVYTGSDPPQYNGGRLGIDFTAPTGIGNNIETVDGVPHDGVEHVASMVNWGTKGWKQKTWDFIVPDTIFTADRFGNPIPPTQITQIVAWLDVRPATELGKVWFADTELYINPDLTFPPFTDVPPTEPPAEIVNSGLMLGGLLFLVLCGLIVLLGGGKK